MILYCFAVGKKNAFSAIGNRDWQPRLATAIVIRRGGATSCRTSEASPGKERHTVKKALGRLFRQRAFSVCAVNLFAQLVASLR